MGPNWVGNPVLHTCIRPGVLRAAMSGESRGQHVIKSLPSRREITFNLDSITAVSHCLV